jgi:hypothetical protein
MKTQKSESKTAVEALPELVQLLSSLTAPEREKAISAAKILLGSSASSPNSTLHGQVDLDLAGSAIDGVASKAASWLQKNHLTRDQLDQVFSIDDKTFDVIAAKMPGKSKRQQTVEAYIICGLKSFLQTGEPNFTDKEGRQLCQKVGCYDQPNHHNYLKAFGNRIGGSKDSGWKLTNPGLTDAAQLIKQLAGNNTASA